MPLANPDQPSHLRLLLHNQPVNLLELACHCIDLTLILRHFILLLLFGDQLITEVDIAIGLSILELEGVAIVFVGVLNIEDAQSLLLVVPEEFVVVEEGEVDVAIVVVVVLDLGVEHASDDLDIHTRPYHEFFSLAGFQLESEGLIRDEVCHVLGELQHVLLLLLINLTQLLLFLILILTLIVILGLHLRRRCVHGIEISLKVDLAVIQALQRDCNQCKNKDVHDFHDIIITKDANQILKPS